MRIHMDVWANGDLYSVKSFCCFAVGCFDRHPMAWLHGDCDVPDALVFGHQIVGRPFRGNPATRLRISLAVVRVCQPVATDHLIGSWDQTHASWCARDSLRRGRVATRVVHASVLDLYVGGDAQSPK